MERPKLSLICPTFGRSTIGEVIKSVLPQLLEGDEFILVGDGPVPLARAVAHLFPRITYMETPKRAADFGCTPCDYAVERATGDYVFFVGDDDVTTPDAFEAIRKGVMEAPGFPHLFAMMHTGRRLGNTVQLCQVSGQQIVIPRDMTRMPKMAAVHKDSLSVSDYVFIEKVVREWGGVVYHNDIICILPKQNHGRQF